MITAYGGGSNGARCRLWKAELQKFTDETGPLSSYEVIVNLIANTTTSSGLTIEATLDTCDYPTGIKVTDEQMRELSLRKHDFHGSDWNYTLEPHVN